MPEFSNTSKQWQASASHKALRHRAELNRNIREFFYQRRVLEVEVPLLSACGVSDPHIDCLSTLFKQQDHYLQSSPEYALKRLLADGHGDVYSICKAFRNGEYGRRHNPEFTMLEWYRLGFDEQQLIAELGELLRGLIPGLKISHTSYGQLFEQHFNVDPHSAELDQLQTLLDLHIDLGGYRCESVSTGLDLLFSHIIEPELADGLVVVDDYPACQAALARLGQDLSGRKVAKRFEAFLDQMEIANGYFELTDAAEQRQRFSQDQQQRQQLGLPDMAADSRLLEALESGLPSCAGVAVGIDRVLMKMLGASHIADVLSFDIGRA